MQIAKDITPNTIRLVAALDESKILYDLHMETKMTYSHLITIKNILVNKGFIKVKKDGRVIHCTLTSRGKELRETCQRLLRIWEEER